MGDHDLLSSLGVEVPYRVVHLKKPPSAFIAEAKAESMAATRASSTSIQRSETPALRARETYVADTNKGKYEVKKTSYSPPSVSRWRKGWAAHPEPVHRSHFSISNPSSLVLESNVEPVSWNAQPLRNHRKASRKPREPDGPHPLDTFEYPTKHRKERQALGKMHPNSMPPAGSPTRTNRSLDILPATPDPPPPPHSLSRSLRQAMTPSSMRGRARSSPARRSPSHHGGWQDSYPDEGYDYAAPAAPPKDRLWTASRDRMDHERKLFGTGPVAETTTYRGKARPSLHKNNFEMVSNARKRQPGEVGQYSTMQEHWRTSHSAQDWETGYETQLAKSARVHQGPPPSLYSIPNYHRQMYEASPRGPARQYPYG